MKDLSSNSGYTKTGFSKSGFGCCARWKECKEGSGSCYYETIDSEVMNYCSLYKNKKNLSKKVLVEVESNTEADSFFTQTAKPIRVEFEQEDCTEKNETVATSIEQLSLF